MTRSELIRRLAELFPQLESAEVERSVLAILKEMAVTLSRGERAEVRGFGSFSVISRTGRMARNPRTGEPVAVTAKYVPHFKAGKELRERVDPSGE